MVLASQLTTPLFFPYWRDDFLENVRINENRHIFFPTSNNSIICIHNSRQSTDLETHITHYAPFSSDAHSEGEWCLTASLPHIHFGFYTFVYSTLHRKSNLCIPKNETVRPHSKFCEHFIYSPDRSASIWLQQNRQTDPGNI